jgi:hypothetical protein
MNEQNKTGLRWLMGLLTFLLFLFPILLSDELSLFHTWLLTLTIWSTLVLLVAIKPYILSKINKVGH